MPAIPSIRLIETVPQGALFHIVRHVFRIRGGFRLHTHRDFAEVFWIEGGSGIHEINGARRPLRRGSLVLVRPGDVHGFRTGRDEPLTLVNLSFPRTVIDDWGRRYFKGGGKSAFFWKQTSFPHAEELDPTQLRRLRKWTETLSTCPNDLFHLDWFFMDLFHSLLANRMEEEGADAMPPLLTRALEQIREPRHFAKGPRHLATLAACSLQHLNRTLRRRLEKTAGQIVVQARLDHAARQLRLTNRTIVEIGLDAGFHNLGHFYLQFKKRFSLTPRQFRLRGQRVVGL